MAHTAAVNVATTGLAGLAGVIIARSLGDTGRGQYGAITAWFGTCLVLGELGVAAATTYFVAREPQRAADVVATSRRMLTGTGTVALLGGLALTPLLSRGSPDAAFGYRLMFITCLAAFAAAGFTFSLQASSLPTWNLVRLSQPALYLAAIVLLHYGGWLKLRTALVALAISLAVQGLLGYWLCARQGLTGGRAERVLATRMLRYASRQGAALLPALLVARLDQLVMSVTVPAAALGRYAVAASVTTLAMPAVSALGYVAFPRLAARQPSAESGVGELDRLRRLAVLGSFIVAAVTAGVLVLASPWLVPLVFGEQFRGSVHLVWMLAPAGVFLGCGQVCGDLLRGYGRPGAVARAQWAAAVLTAVLLALLLPRFGVVAAALTSTLATGLALLLMLVELRRYARQGSAAS